ncbi:LysR family transcriptional regulator [Aminobacter sp. Piv2-1]|uniref:LysR family transcriptional regulator n=1 Tax=Aminobacter sp. Piv2-1 TaxID=3031122 RepID=UPI00309759C4
MDIDRARTFLEIVQGGSFLKAAERLHVTQTTVSARIRTLEQELGRQLFVRNRSGAQLTAAGRDFERYAQSFVQVWERARHQLAVPSGRTSLLAIGGELSLWNPLLLDWLVWMRQASPEIAIRAHVGVPDQLLDQLRTGVLDIAVLYAPKLLPGFKVEILQEEQLVLVRTTSKQGRRDPAENYVYVDWGPTFAAQHDAGSNPFGEPGLFVGLGPLGLNYILRAGGMGYFRRGIVAPLVAAGELERVEGAPEFTYPVYAVYPEAIEARSDLQDALLGLRRAMHEAD